MGVTHEPPPAHAPEPSRYPDRDPQLFYELVKDRLATQLETLDALDNKFGILISLGSALMGILIAVLAIRGRPFGAPELAAISASGLFYLVGTGLSAFAYYGRDWEVGPELERVWNDYWKADEDNALLTWKLARDFWAYYDNNLPAQKLKANCLPVVLGLVIGQTLALCAALGLVAAGA